MVKTVKKITLMIVFILLFVNLHCHNFRACACQYDEDYCYPSVITDDGNVYYFEKHRWENDSTEHLMHESQTHGENNSCVCSVFFNGEKKELNAIVLNVSATIIVDNKPKKIEKPAIMIPIVDCLELYGADVSRTEDKDMIVLAGNVLILDKQRLSLILNADSSCDYLTPYLGIQNSFNNGNLVYTDIAVLNRILMDAGIKYSININDKLDELYLVK